jgi:hypothetical protein
MMNKFNSTARLKNAIYSLEVEQMTRRHLLIEQFYQTYDSFKPVNILKSSLNDIASSPYLIDNILGTAVGLVSGYLSKKIVVGASGNLLRKLFGFLMQLGVTNTVTQHPDAIKTIGRVIYQYFLSKKRV